MTQSQLSLSWDAHQKNVCNGLSVFQQRGEFVDMTLAADGHHVKVHQMVLSLVSLYIKELITSAQCPHPVIFLNNISYSTLCAILEYIYMGEVLVATDKLPDLIAAGKALHIKGLKEIVVDDEEISQSVNPIATSSTSTPKNTDLSKKLRDYTEKKKEKQNNEAPVRPMCKIFVNDIDNNCHEDLSMDTQNYSSDDLTEVSLTKPKLNPKQKHSKYDNISEMTPKETRKTIMNPILQFTISNQGGLQVIYNRYIYHLKYFGKKNRLRHWRCIDYKSTLKCPANICTDENNQVASRSFSHNHPFHDIKILKKHRYGIIYSAVQEAESKKKERHLPCSSKLDEESDE